MNMIPTGAFLTEMDASEKKETLAEQFVSIWEKKNSKIARAGGVSLMALSLAACGSSSDDTAATDTPAAETPAAETPAEETPAAETPAEETPAEETPVEVTPVATELAISALTADTTFKTTDDLDGGAGAADELSLTMGADFAGFATTGDDTGSMVGYEVVSLAADTIDRTFDATGVSGVETYKIDGANGGVVSLTDVAELPAIELSNIASGSFSIAYDATAAANDGTADTLSLTVEGMGSATADIAVTAAGMEAVALTSNAAATAAGATNYLDLSGVSAATDITVTGAADTDIAAVAATFDTLDASAATGAITANLSAAGGIVAGDIQSVKTGSGDDTVTVVTTDLDVLATIELGAGADTLDIDGGTATLRPVMSGVETLDVTDQTGTLTLNLRDASGVEEVVVTDAGVAASGTKYAGTLNMSDATGDLAVTITGDAGGTITSDTSGALTITAAADVDGSKTNQSDADTVITAAKASSVAISAGANVELGGAITAAKATSLTVDTTSASAAAGAINVAKAETVSFTAADTYTAGDGDFTGAKVVNLTTTKAMSFANDAAGFKAASDVNIVGNASTAAVTTTVLGDADLAYDLDVNVSGTEAGATLGVVDAGAGTLTVDTTAAVGDVSSTSMDGGAVTVTNDSAEGAISTGDVTADTGAVTISAKDAIGNVTVGAITASKGAVTVDLSGSLGTLAVGAISGKSVAIDVTDALGTATNVVGDGDIITTGSSFTYTGALDVATDFDVLATATSTATTVTTAGGSGIDSLEIGSNVKTASITVTGDFGDGTDEIIISTDGAGVAGDEASTATEVTIDISGAEDYNSSNIDAGNVDHVITGGEDVDVILTGSGDDTISGGDGNDDLTAGTGADTINGGDGDDAINAGGGEDTISGGAGTDTITLTADAASDSITASEYDIVVNFDPDNSGATGDELNVTVAEVQGAISQTDLSSAVTLDSADTIESYAVAADGLVTLYDEATGVGTTELFADSADDIAAVIEALVGAADITDGAVVFKVDADGNGTADGSVVVAQTVSGYEAAYMQGVVATGLETTESSATDFFIA